MVSSFTYVLSTLLILLTKNSYNADSGWRHIVVVNVGSIVAAWRVFCSSLGWKILVGMCPLWYCVSFFPLLYIKYYKYLELIGYKYCSCPLSYVPKNLASSGVPEWEDDVQKAFGGISRWDWHLGIWKWLSDEKSTMFFTRRMWKPDTEFLNLVVYG